MTMKQYLISSARTAAGSVFTGLAPWSVLVAVVQARIDASHMIDGAKKALFYGKRKPIFHDLVTDIMKEDGAILEYPEGIEPDLIHAALGVDSESTELLEVLQTYLETGVIDREKFMDEAGDLQWYLAMLYRKIGTTFEEVGERNIAKLMVRYPNKFDAELATTHRDDAKERVVFQ
ncbi:MazG nucleotide pyrophosphohydrolase domain-containing protein [Mesorhizobium sp. STM 4661]|uniref:MazG nucleotide pyrophosphohydrolase domain-containing protein n=1 Tax=Mesorhizobium sp. STM 4661 TaxID=1297570 RepID=UPI0002BF0BF1|nr:MazG nucleotide pyrophosphohydrolase domain-containing protein [Mesorhizobium sp. STM 4661]CCV12909.1 MazG nucleotide pyrophosphohydrolase (modular protein) [Mesorhizobium sp. STM 4661]